MSTIRDGGRAIERRTHEPTSESVWRAMFGGPITDELLEWPPDLFALVNVVLEDSEAFRFALSPLGAWPPRRVPNWADAVEEAARRWSAWVEDGRGSVPDLVIEEWSAFRERADMPLEELAEGNDWRMCEALLTLHAIADEACAGLGIALDKSDGQAVVYRARGRELLVRTGSMARINPRSVRGASEGSHPVLGTSVVLTVRLCARPGDKRPLAQEPRSSSRCRPPVRVREHVAAPVAAARAGV